jgi:hypothetical protein
MILVRFSRSASARRAMRRFNAVGYRRLQFLAHDPRDVIRLIAETRGLRRKARMNVLICSAAS